MRIAASCAIGLLATASALWPAGARAAGHIAATAMAGATEAHASLTLSTPTISRCLGVSGTDAVLRPRSLSGLGVPVPMPVADEVIVRKSERRLYLMRHGKVLRSYHISLGLEPQGPKERAGDFRTPEGHYFLTRRNPRSDYFLSILVSYPSARERAVAEREHVDPGGEIMLHGLPNILRHKPAYYRHSDWTDGCIALSDSDMVEVWLMTRDNTPIDILP
jgi:L,D-transpeptidase catalytic domain